PAPGTDPLGAPGAAPDPEDGALLPPAGEQDAPAVQAAEAGPADVLSARGPGEEHPTGPQPAFGADRLGSTGDGPVQAAPAAAGGTTGPQPAPGADLLGSAGTGPQDEEGPEDGRPAPPTGGPDALGVQARAAAADPAGPAAAGPAERPATGG